jgi:hypothetical protein
MSPEHDAATETSLVELGRAADRVLYPQYAEAMHYLESLDGVCAKEVAKEYRAAVMEAAAPLYSRARRVPMTQIFGFGERK